MADLPLRVQSVDEGESPGGTLGTTKGRDTGTRRRPRVLIVEDHDDTREMYAWSLRAAGWNVEPVATVKDALLVVASFEPDVIVVDLHLPDVSGLDLVRHVKDGERARDIRVVVCTAFGSERARAEATALGCDEFLCKPLDPERLREIVERVALRG